MELSAVNGRVFVGDTVARRVLVFDFPQSRYYEFGDQGLGRLAKPLGIAADQNGRIYVCDGTSKRVLVYDLEGTYLTAVGGDGMLNRPSGVAVSPDGSRIYVVDTGGVQSQDHRIRAFGPDGAHLFDIGTRGAERANSTFP